MPRSGRTKKRRWIGIDGEGVGRAPHRYVLLACSDGDYVQAREGLSTVDCLEFLISLGTRDARVCGYYLGYDWTKILQDLPNESIYHLFRPELRALDGGTFTRVEYKGYELHWLAGAMWLRDDKRRVTIWDIGKYYQQPFVGALKVWNVRPDVQKQIASMKAKRDKFAWREIAKIRKYCMQEVEALAELASKLEQAHTEAELTPRSWFGPGSSASVLLNRHDIREQRGFTPSILVEPIAVGFIGGRAEISRSGFVEGPIFGQDISSAYPAHATHLPCLVHGRWEKVAKEKMIKSRDVAHAIVYGHISDVGKCAWGPLPIRRTDSTIVYPRSGGSGWWWRDEWIAAREGWKGLAFDHAYVLRRECNCKPFSFIPELFELRKRVGKESGNGLVLKLTINSLYGKLAQTIGRAQFASRAWAGMITSGTRAQVLRLLMQHKRMDSVLMIATDGLFSTEPLAADYIKHDDGREQGKVVLGGWERSEYESITLIRPGIYWIGDQKIRARGLGRDNLDKRAQRLLCGALERGAKGVVLAPKTNFGTAKASITQDSKGRFKRHSTYGEWHGVPPHVSLEPGPKRSDDWSLVELSEHESCAFGTRASGVQHEVFEILELLREVMY